MAVTPDFAGQASKGSYPGCGGGLSGGNVTRYEDGTVVVYGANQSSGHAFGYGKDGEGLGGNIGVAGGGGGYYGGTVSEEQSTNYNSASGGSSFISGHAGCVALASSQDTTPSTAGADNSVERAKHYSGKYFTNTLMIDGAGYEWTTEKGSLKPMPNPDGGNYESGEGRTGDGYARITLTRW